MARTKSLDNILKEIDKQIIEDTKANLKPYKNLVQTGAKYAQLIKNAKKNKSSDTNLDTWVKALFQCNNQIIKAYSGNIDLRVYIGSKSDDLNDNDAINYEQFYQIDFTDFDFIKKHLKFSQGKGFTFSYRKLSRQSSASEADHLSDDLYRITSHLTGYLRHLYSHPDDTKSEKGINIEATAAEGDRMAVAFEIQDHAFYKAKVTYPNYATDYINFKFSSEGNEKSKIHPYYSESTTEEGGSYFSYAWLREHSLEVGRRNVNNVVTPIKKELLYDLVRQTFLQKVDHVPAARIGDVPGEDLIGSTQVKAGRKHLMKYSQIEQMADAFIQMSQASSDEKLEKLIEIYYNENTKFQMNWKSLTSVIRKAEEDITGEEIDKLLEAINRA